MKGKDLMAWTIKDRRDAHFCFHGARTLLHYLDAMVGMIDGVRQNEDIECLHRMRVASRRLRSLLPLFDDCLPAKQTVRWRKQLRRVTRALGEARDADVQAVCLLDALKDCTNDLHRPGLERLLLRFRQKRSALQAPLTSTPGTARIGSPDGGGWKWPCATSLLPANYTPVPESALHSLRAMPQRHYAAPAGSTGRRGDHSRPA